VNLTYASTGRKPRVGERVRVVREGTVTKISEFGYCMWLDGNAAYSVSLTRGAPHTIEILEEYESEAVYLDARGQVYQFFGAAFCGDGEPPCWNAVGDMNEIPFDRPVRPLRMIVNPEGKAV
jgi:hypothetical protein